MNTNSAHIREYVYCKGISTCGNWLRMVSLNWIVVTVLSGDTADNMLRFALVSTFTLGSTFLPRITLSARMLIVLAQTGYILISLGLFIALYRGCLTVSGVAVAELVATVIGIVINPTISQLESRLAGDHKRAMADILYLLEAIGRGVAGSAVLVLVVFAKIDVGVVLLIDAISFLPFIWALLRSPASSQIDVEAGMSVMESIRRGWGLMWRPGSAVLVMTWIENINLFLGGLLFCSCAERLGRELSLGLMEFALWTTATGFTGMAGLLVARRLSAYCRNRWFVWALLVIPLLILVIGATSNLWVFIGCYTTVTFIGIPVGATFSAFQMSQPSKEDVTGLTRIKSFISGLALAPLMIGYTFGARYVGLSAGSSLALLSAICFLLFVATFSYVHIRDRHYFQKHLPS